MSNSTQGGINALIQTLSPEQAVLIAGPTASGKSALALEIASRQGGVIVNADASQVYDCFQIVTARPSPEEEALAPHRLYGHVRADQDYSAGHWLREVSSILDQNDRPIIVGGTGLYFLALTAGLAQIPPTPAEIRQQGDLLTLTELLAGVDSETLARLDLANRARVQRAWEVQQATGRSLRSWQVDTPPPLLPVQNAHCVVFDTDKEWLNDRIQRRFDLMLAQGALAEVAGMLDRYTPSLPAHRAIGVPELVAYLRGEQSLDAAREAAVIATRQFAKRQRTWFRSKMREWIKYSPIG